MTDTAAEEAPVEVRDERREALLERFQAELGEAIVGTHIAPGFDLWIRIDRAAWVDTFRMLREDHNMRYFNWLSGIDWMPSPFGRDMDSEVDTIVYGKTEKAPEPMATGYAGGDTRFQVIARVNNVRDHSAVIVKADIPDDDLVVDTITGVYAGASWHERETREMYGIDFAGHPDPRNIYLPTDFKGFPLRKDFPLLARRVKPWPGIVDVEPMPGEDEGDGEGGDA